MLKQCPSCSQEAKESQAYPGTYVCRCLGYLEDISKISPKSSIRLEPPSAINHEHGQPKLTQTNQSPTLWTSPIQTVAELRALRTTLGLFANSDNQLAIQLSRSKWFRVHKNYCIIYGLRINSQKLITNESHFFIQGRKTYQSS
jgi:hypothetical protein